MGTVCQGGEAPRPGGTAVADGPAKNRRVGLTGRVDGGLVQGGGGHISVHLF